MLELQELELRELELQELELQKLSVILTDPLTELLGWVGIAVSGLSAVLLVLFVVALFWPESRQTRQYVIPLVLVFFGAAADRFIFGSTLVSSATELDATDWEKLLALFGRLVMSAGLLLLLVNAYRSLSRSGSQSKDEERGDLRMDSEKQ